MLKRHCPLSLYFVAGLAVFDWNEVACSGVCVCHGSIKAPPIHPSSRSPASASEYRSGAARTTSEINLHLPKSIVFDFTFWLLLPSPKLILIWYIIC